MKTHVKKPETTTWLTPPEFIRILGPFDLDPCCPPDMPWETAKRMISPLEDGLKSKWPKDSFVWLNPPFTRGEREKWMEKMTSHPGGGIMLIPAATDTVAFQKNVFGEADALFFLYGRPHFHDVHGDRSSANCGCAICLVAYGRRAVRRLAETWDRRLISGHLVHLGEES